MCISRRTFPYLIEKKKNQQQRRQQQKQKKNTVKPVLSGHPLLSGQ